MNDHVFGDSWASDGSVINAGDGRSVHLEFVSGWQMEDSKNIRCHKSQFQRVRKERDEWELRVLADPDLTKIAYRVASFIGRKLNIKRADFFWGEESIAYELNASPRSVRRATKQLREKEYIYNKGRSGSHGTRIYGIMGRSSTGQPCPVEGAVSAKASSNPRSTDSTGHDCPVENEITSTVVQLRPPRPDKSKRSTGHKLVVNRTVPTPKPIEPKTTLADDGGCALRARQPSSSARKTKRTDAHKNENALNEFSTVVSRDLGCFEEPDEARVRVTKEEANTIMEEAGYLAKPGRIRRQHSSD